MNRIRLFSVLVIINPIFIISQNIDYKVTIGIQKDTNVKINYSVSIQNNDSGGYYFNYHPVIQKKVESRWRRHAVGAMILIILMAQVYNTSAYGASLQRVPA